MNNNEHYDENFVLSVCRSLIPKIQHVEDERIEVVRRTRKFWNISLIIIALTGVLLFGAHHTILEPDNSLLWEIGIGITVLIAICIYHSYYVSKVFKQFKSKFDNEVIKALIQSFLHDSVFQPNGCISINEYYDSVLFKKTCDRYNGRNYISGVLDKTAIRFSQLHTEYKTETRTKNGGRQVHWHTIFRGIFMVADPNKNFKGDTFILPDFSERLFGGIGKWFQKNIGDSRGKIVYMENPEFEKKFAVYSTDPVEARYLITPSMQEHMLTLLNHVKGGVCASFKGGKLYLAINKNTGLFELNTSLSLLNVDTLKLYAKDLIDMLSIVHILDLNTRIWGRD